MALKAGIIMFQSECPKLAGCINSRDHGLTSTCTATQPIDNLGTNNRCGVALLLLRRTNPTSALVFGYFSGRGGGVNLVGWRIRNLYLNTTPAFCAMGIISRIADLSMLHCTRQHTTHNRHSPPISEDQQTGCKRPFGVASLNW